MGVVLNPRKWVGLSGLLGLLCSFWASNALANDQASLMLDSTCGQAVSSTLSVLQSEVKVLLENSGHAPRVSSQLPEKISDLVASLASCESTYTSVPNAPDFAEVIKSMLALKGLLQIAIEAQLSGIDCSLSGASDTGVISTISDRVIALLNGYQ